jgi:hypothetical protein
MLLRQSEGTAANLGLKLSAKVIDFIATWTKISPSTGETRVE